MVYVTVTALTRLAEMNDQSWRSIAQMPQYAQSDALSYYERNVVRLFVRAELEDLGVDGF